MLDSLDRLSDLVDHREVRKLVLGISAVLLLALLVPAPASAQDGLLDLSYGKAGHANANFKSRENSANALTLVAGGKSVVAGNSNGKVAFARFTSQGKLDKTFGSAGTGRVRPGQQGDVKAIAKQGSALVYAWQGSNRINISRLKSNGTLDSRFSTTAISAMADATEMVVRKNGKILISGTGSSGGMAAQVLPNGGMDRAFNFDGIREFPSSKFATGIALGAGGRVHVAAHNATLARPLPAGMVAFADKSWDLFMYTLASDGSDLATPARIDTGRPEMTSGLTAKGGKVYVTALAAPKSYAQGPINSWLIARFTKNGKLDPTWGGNGLVNTKPGVGDATQARRAAVQSDGRVVVSGVIQTVGSFKTGILRYWPNGKLDPSFGNSGIVAAPMPPGLVGPTDMAMRSSGTILISEGAANGSRFTVTQYRNSGQGTYALSSKIKKPGKKVSRKKTRYLEGIASGVGLKYVKVAVNKVSKALLTSKHKCIWLANGGSTTKKKATKTSQGWVCKKPNWLRASGTVTWKYTMGGLKKGNYRAWSKAIGKKKQQKRATKKSFTVTG